MFVDLKGLEESLAGGRRLLVYLHDNPDPDCLAAGWLLASVGKFFGLKPVLVYGGRLGRAENRAMVKLLKIPLRSLEKSRPRLLKSDRFAMVDSQPGAGNNSFPHQSHRCHVVIDHHPSKSRPEADFVDIQPDMGCCTTMVLAYHQALGLELSADLATAVAYAIISETQDMGRETTRADQEAYMQVFPKVRLRALGSIRHPVRSRAYFRNVARAMSRVMVGRHTCVCHMGPVESAEVVAEVADLFAAMERISWCMVSGLVPGQIHISMRSRRPEARAERIMRRLLGRQGKGGGHGMIAGGLMPCACLEDYPERAEYLTERFLKLLGRRQPERLHLLLEEVADCANPILARAEPE